MRAPTILAVEEALLGYEGNLIMKAFLFVVAFVALSALGVLGVFFPETIQAFTSKPIRIDVGAVVAQVTAYVRANVPLVGMRAAGIAAFALCVLLAVNLYRGAR